MPYKTQNPHLGPSGNVESFAETEWPNGRKQLGYVHEDATKGYQCVKVVDAAVADLNNVLYWKNYASYEVTPTIGNSSRNEPAGINKCLVGAANTYIWIQQRGLSAVKGAGAAIARGDLMVSDSADNQVVEKPVDAAGSLTDFTVIGRALGALAADTQGITTDADEVPVFLTLAPI